MFMSTSSLSLSVAQVQQSIQQAIRPLARQQQCKLAEALHRVLAMPIYAPIDVPAFDNSAMDGYAFGAADLPRLETLAIVGRAHAGHPFQQQLQSGQAIHITTGAALPIGADTIIPEELAQLDDALTLSLRGQQLRPGQHRRARGEDLASGSIALAQGTTLGAAELGVLGALGLDEVTVVRRPRVAIFSTGDELRLPGQPLLPGCVYDSNRITLQTLLIQAGADVLDLGILPDDPAAIETALRQVMHQVDMIITSGGMAGGAADFTAQVMRKLGQMQFWSVAMRPGRPLAFGQIAQPSSEENTTVFGLPGNPVAMMISFYLFVRPALQHLSGAAVAMLPIVKAITRHAIAKKVGRTEFQRGIYSIEDGVPQVSSTGEQGSNMLSSMVQANCLLMLPPEQGDIVAGDAVGILLFQGFM